MTVEEIIINAIAHISIWQEMLFVVLFLIITGAFACLVTLCVVQWIGKLTFGPDPNDQRKKDERTNRRTKKSYERE